MTDRPQSEAPEPALEAEPRPGTRGLIPHLSPASRPGFVGDDVPPPHRPTAGLSMVGMTAVVYGGLAAVAVAWAALGDGRFVGLHPAHVAEPGHLLGHAPLGAAAGLGFGLLVVALSRLTLRFAWGRRLHMEFHEVLAGLDTRHAFYIALLSAAGEEAFFRGALQPAVGLWLSAGLFGLLHFPVRRGLWPWPLLAFGMGLAFGVLFEKGGDLSGPLVAHFVINFLNLRHIAKTRYPHETGIA